MFAWIKRVFTKINYGFAVVRLYESGKTKVGIYLYTKPGHKEKRSDEINDLAHGYIQNDITIRSVAVYTFKVHKNESTQLRFNYRLVRSNKSSGDYITVRDDAADVWMTNLQPLKD